MSVVVKRATLVAILVIGLGFIAAPIVFQVAFPMPFGAEPERWCPVNRDRIGSRTTSLGFASMSLGAWRACWPARCTTGPIWD